MFEIIKQFAITGISGAGLPHGDASNTTVSDLLLTVLFPILGGIAVLVITVAGLRYILSDGDPQKAATAKNTIIYAVVGLAIAASAEATVAFIAGKL